MSEAELFVYTYANAGIKPVKQRFLFTICRRSAIIQQQFAIEYELSRFDTRSSTA